MTKRAKSVLGAALSLFITAALAAAAPAPAGAQQFTFRLHNFNSPRALANRAFMVPWAKKIEKESGGRIRIQVFPAMQLGGKPKDLYAQVRDGVVDLAWVLQGYTAGQFPLTAVFEMPFIGGSAEAVSQALMEFYGMYLKDEYKDVHPIVLHATDVGIVHAKFPVRRLEDLKGVKIRAPSRWVGQTLKAFGAVPVGMPLPRLPQALTRGQVEGMMIPWSITRPFKLLDLTKYHTEIAIYHSPFMLVMNKASYARLPADLKKVIDDNSGMKLARRLGRLWDADARKSRALAVKKGNTIISLGAEEAARWRRAVKPVYEAWIRMANAKGLDGRKMLADAARLVKKYRK